MRLQKFLAAAGVASRRRAEEMIAAGRVKVDGLVVCAMGVPIDPSVQSVELDGVTVTAGVRPLYLLLNKPRGYVTTANDPQGRPTVLDLLSGISQRVFPVGRLDLDTEGALILTNDGAFAHRILHPAFEIPRIYRALVSGRPSAVSLAALAGGIELDGRRTAAAKLRIISPEKDAVTVEIVLHEGRKRQVRRMFEAVGHPVLRLRRVAYGGLTLGALLPGRFRLLDGRDLEQIFSGKKTLYK